MFNGIGLTTPRGSGTNGYVVRNLSHLRPRDENWGKKTEEFDRGGPRMREPDQGILEHEKRRKIEVRCLEFQVELEDKGVAEDEIEKQVSELRERLLANLNSMAPTNAKNLKASDTHGIAAAKKAELSKMARALGTSANYQEGDSFNREKQDQIKQQRAVERVERDKRREEARATREADEKAAKEKEAEFHRQRRRKEYYSRLEKEKERDDGDKKMPPPSSMPPSGPRQRDAGRARSRSRSPPVASAGSRRPRSRSPPRHRDDRDSRSRSPPSRRRRVGSLSRSRSPPRRRDSRSPPAYHRRTRDSRSPPARDVRMDSPPPRRRSSRSISPPLRSSRRSLSPPRRRSPSPDSRDYGRTGRRADSRSISPPPAGRSRRSPTPPRRTRARSGSGSQSEMSVSSGEE